MSATELIWSDARRSGGDVQSTSSHSHHRGGLTPTSNSGPWTARGLMRRKFSPWRKKPRCKLQVRTSKKKAVDWRKIKAAWIVGSPSIRALSREWGVSDTAIRKKAREENWPDRPANLGSQAASDCKPEQTAKAEASSSPMVAASADADPKALVKAGRSIVEMLLRELSLVSDHVELLERIIEEETAGDRSLKRRQLLLRIVSLPVRTQAARNLTSALIALAEHGPGKKEQAKDAAETAGGEGTGWGNDLDPYATGKPN